MASLDELKQKLNSTNWKERRDAAQALGQMKDQRDEVIPLLKRRLMEDNDLYHHIFIDACIEALEQLEGLDDDTFQFLTKRISHPYSLVRRSAVHALTKFQGRVQDATSLLKERLRVDDNSGVIEACIEALEKLESPAEVVADLKAALAANSHWHPIIRIIESLHDKGVTIEEMSHILATNPSLRTWPAHEWAHVLHRGWEPGGAVIELVVRRRWWRLPVETRRYLGLPLTLEGWWHHCPECHIMWRELIHLLERGGRRREEAQWLIATMGRWWGNLRWRFGCHDFEELMSLRVEQSVTYEEVNTLRFRFLDAFATDCQDRPISQWARDWLREFQQDWDRLLQTEEQFDRVRDEISELRRQQDEILREAERRIEGKRGWEPGKPPRLPEDLQGRWNEVAERLRRLEGDVEPGELQRLRRPLEEATERLMPQLRERGVCLKVIEVEGVLGEYNFYERKVTLYPPMIELAAMDLATALKWQPNEVYEHLHTVVEMHETAHATTHLGIDSNGMLWERPENGSSELHETLAQFYTFHLIQRLNESRLERVFLELNKEQPERYQFWQVLRGVPLEMAREFLIGKRAGWFRGDLLTLAKDAANILDSAMPLLRTVLSDKEFQAFINGLKPIVQSLASARTRRELGEAAEAFLAHCETHPFVRSLLEKALPGGLHSVEYRKLLLANWLVEGEPVKASSLRLTMDQIKASQIVGLMQNEVILQNEIVHGLREAAALRALASPDELARVLLYYLPSDKAESIQIIERLRKLVEQR